MEACIELCQVNLYIPGQPEPLLEKIHLSVHKGEWLAVTGRNASGKSMLARLIAGLDGAYTGQIRRSLQGVHVQLVMQNPEAQLIGDTVWEDVCCGLENRGVAPEDIRHQARAALEATGLAGLEHQPVHKLSGGQKQLLAAAAAIATNPDVLITDEATSMLDPLSRKRMMQLLGMLHKEGKTIIMITQMMEEVIEAERIIALDKGSLVFDGTKTGFFYGDQLTTSCEAAGLTLPYTIRVARELQRRGLCLQGYPMTPEELAKVVS